MNIKHLVFALASLLAAFTAKAGTPVNPVLGPATSTAITSTSATLGGIITDFHSGGAITEWGVVYSRTSVNSNPIIGEFGVTKVTAPLTGGMGPFSVAITGLAANTQYSFRAFANNVYMTEGYSDLATFTTGGGGPANTAPVITTPTSADVALTTATLGGNVTADGGAAIAERGVVYSLTATNADPLISGTGVTKVTATGTMGVFTTAVTGLTSISSYSFKAYATNSVGTSYTSAAAFTTGPASIPMDTVIGGQEVDSIFAPGVVGTTLGTNNWPAENVPANAFDGQAATNYRNFGKIVTALVFSPQAGNEQMAITNLVFTTANDAPERDPINFTLYGSTTKLTSGAVSIEPLTLLSSSSTGLFSDPGRSSDGPAQPIGNPHYFASYVLIFHGVRDADTADSMQIGEVKFYGVPGTKPEPDISLYSDEEFSDKANGSTFDFRVVERNVGRASRFVVINNGKAPLLLDGASRVRISGTDAANFTVTTQPAAMVGANGQSEFFVHFTPTTRGVKTATLTIENNDPDSDPFVLNLTGSGSVYGAIPMEGAIGVGSIGRRYGVGTVGEVPNTNNWPATATPAMAIDGNATTQYVNFSEGAGVIVSPRAGSEGSVLAELTFITGADHPENDPLTVSVYGLPTRFTDTTPGTSVPPRTLIYSGTTGLARNSDRSTAGAKISILNNTAFASYVIAFGSIGQDATQIGEITFRGPVPDEVQPTTGKVYSGLLTDGTGKVRGSFLALLGRTGFGSVTVWADGKRGSMKVLGETSLTILVGGVPMTVNFPPGAMASSGNPTRNVSVTIGAETMTGIATLSPYELRRRTLNAGKYTFAATSETGAPRLAAVMSGSITSFGGVRITVRLGNGRVATFNSQEQGDGGIAFYCGYGIGGAQSLAGYLTIESQTAPQITGLLRWTVPAGMDARMPAGLDADYDTVGARYKAGAVSSLLTLDPSKQIALGLEIPTLTPSKKNYTFPMTANVISFVTTRPYSQLRFFPATGMFSGTTSYDYVQRNFYGVLLQGSGLNYGVGYLQDTNALGTVSIQPESLR